LVSLAPLAWGFAKKLPFRAMRAVFENVFRYGVYSETNLIKSYLGV
jgi:hypothetical protein